MQKTRYNLEELVNKYKNHGKIFFEPLSGNNGDKLIEMGARYFISLNGLEIVKNPLESDVILINGSGGMTKEWGAFDTALHYINTYTDKPVIIFPSSWNLNETDFDKISKRRTANLYLFSREKISYKKLLQTNYHNPYIYCGLGEDMAFKLKDSKYIKSLRNKTEHRKVLIIERTDQEKPTAIETKESTLFDNIKKSIKLIFPENTHKYLAKVMVFFMRPYKKNKMEKIWKKSKILNITKDLLNREEQYKIVLKDVSDHTVYTFKEFEEEMKTAEIIITTRLHGAILGAMLGKETYFINGVWHKFLGVYEHSLKSYPNVRLVDYNN